MDFSWASSSRMAASAERASAEAAFWSAIRTAVRGSEAWGPGCGRARAASMRRRVAWVWASLAAAWAAWASYWAP